MGGWQGFRILRWLTYGSFAFYALAAPILTQLNNGFEIFPFFDWSLYVPERREFSIYQLELTLPREPGPVICVVPDCPALPALLRSTGARAIIQSVGRLYEASSPKFEEHRRQLEAMLRSQFGADLVPYRVLRAEVDAREFARTREPRLRTLIFAGGAP